MTQSPQQLGELTQLGHYTILSSIGRGGMGLVYLARDSRLDRQVAIKCLRTDLIEPHYRERFKREALLLAKLNHPNIVQIYDYLETNEQLALVMEYVDGQNLQQHLREHIVSHAQRMQWLAQIAQGLAIAHDAGIIHRDLKAENILINKRKLAKITDLGIAKSQDFSGTLTDHVTGSYGSMSPEQAMGEELDFRSDLFSFGILAYQLLCGAHPFGETENKLQLMQRIISHPAISPLKKNPDLLPEAVELLGQLLSKDPNNRPDSTHWVAAQCEKLYQVMAINSAAETNSTQILPHSPTDPSGVLKRNKSSGRAQEHSTFDTSIAKKSAPLAQRAKMYIRNNSITLGFIGITIAILAGGVIWQLQPKAPKYVAVIPPKLTAEGMQESQQELVKGAVYDAIQQSVIQLDGYYLIPQSEIADVNGNTETVLSATAADELLTAEINCHDSACTITLSRLLVGHGTEKGRLSVRNKKIIDALIDSYLLLSSTITTSTNELYFTTSLNNTYKDINEQDYNLLLEVGRSYEMSGAAMEQLASLDSLDANIKYLPTALHLYTEIGLDLYHASGNKTILYKIENVLRGSPNKDKNSNFLTNLFYWQVAAQHFEDAEKTIKIIRQLLSEIYTNELEGYLLLAKKDFSGALNIYKKIEASKPTANIFFLSAKAHWYSGNYQAAREYIGKSLAMAAYSYKANYLNGIIALTNGNLTEAKKSYLTILEKNPHDFLSLSNLGLTYMLEKNYSQAQDTFQKAYTLNPNDTILLLNMADNYSLNNKFTAGKDLYHTLINLEKERPITAIGLRSTAEALAHLELYQDALSTLRKLEKLDPQSEETYYTAALVHTLAKNNMSAIMNIASLLNKGRHPTWLGFRWFDSLCGEYEFIALLKKHGEHERCALPALIKDAQY